MINPTIRYYDNGDVKAEYWYVNDELHRLNGPAIIRYSKNDNIKNKFWYVNGIVIKNPPKNWPLTTDQIIELKLLYG